MDPLPLRRARLLARCGLLLLLAGAACGLITILNWNGGPGASAGRSGEWATRPLTTWGAPLLGVILAAGGLALHGWAVRRGRLTPKSFLLPEEEAAVLDAIRSFERKTSGELRVHLAADRAGDPRVAAEQTFDRLEMSHTARRNGVLFYVDVAQRRFVVLGDEGIHRAVGEEFWTLCARKVESGLSAGAYGAGLCAGIRLAGEALAEHFPWQEDDVNELPDEISRD